MAPPTSYDEVPYTSYPYARSRPENLEVLARLFGMLPPDSEECRVLELGCAGGGNLIPLAATSPRASFLGVDLSRRQIDEGCDTIAALGLQNIRLEHRDIADVGRSDGPFDYVICHGVYSWVPQATQQKMLDICRDTLRPQGVAYVSYNTLPGWHMRGMVREMMNYHAEGFDDPASRVAQSRALLDFLLDAMPGDGSAYELLLNDELQVLRACEDSYLYHEHLEDVNEPIYFHQFVDRAAAAGLQFLAEAQLSDMVPNRFSEETQRTLSSIAPDIIRMEQYLDFLRNRTFRHTLLCRRDVRLDRTIQPDRIRDLFVASPVSPAQPEADLRSTEDLVFEHPSGSTVEVQAPILKAALIHLGENWPHAVPYEQLRDHARAEVGDGPDSNGGDSEDDQRLGHFMLECFAANVLELRARSDRFTCRVSQRPEAFAVARRQAEGGELATNLRHERVPLGQFDRRALRLLDGRHDRESLCDELIEPVIKGELDMRQDGRPVTDPEVIREALGEALDQVLPRLAEQALLVG